MKVAIVNTAVPFIYGGAEFLADSLANELENRGHLVQVYRIPFCWNPTKKIVESRMACRMLDVSGADKVIALKFPAYFINHPNKTLWLLHQFRQVYDFEGTRYALEETPENLEIKRAIISADNELLSDKYVKHIYTNSKVVSDRLKKYNGFESEVLYPPLMDAEKFYCGECGDYIFYPSRISHYKRQYLAVEAMRYVKSGVKLIIAGKGDSPADEDNIENLIKKYKLEGKVTYIKGFISQEYKAELFANSLGGIYIPYDEDSYGYVTLEAYQSKKPVISCFDSGGTDVVVKDGLTGYMVESKAKALAEAMDKLYLDKSNAIKLGEDGFEHIREIGITWENVIERLLD